METYYTYQNKELGVIAISDNQRESYFQRLLEENYESEVNGFLETIFFTEENIKFSYDLEKKVWTVTDFLNTEIVQLSKNAKKYYNLRNKK